MKQHFILQNIKQAEPQRIADAILNGEITFEECKETNQFFHAKQKAVKDIIDPILAERKLFEQIENCTDTEEAFGLISEYLSKYPEGEHVSAVLAIQDRQQDKLAYDQAKENRGNPQKQIIALQGYIQRFSNGRYVASAKAAIENYEYELRAEKERIIKNLKTQKTSSREILEMLDNGLLNKSDLVPEYISEAGLQHFMEGGRYVDLGINDELGPIRGDSTDVYFIGVPNSGKSCLLAGLLLFAERHYKPTLTIEPANIAGYKYAYGLLEAAQDGLVPGSTDQNERSINYIATNLQDQEYPDYEHPINFIEMSGEHIVSTFEKMNNELESIPFHQYLRSNNDKYFFIVVDYSSTHKQGKYLSSIIELFKQFEKHSNIIKRTRAINLVLTKSDLLDGGTNDVQMAIDYIQQDGGPYHNLYSQLELLYKKNSHLGGGKKSLFSVKGKNAAKKPKIYPYSLGEFELFSVSFKYNKIPSEKLFWDILKRTAAVKIQ